VNPRVQLSFYKALFNAWCTTRRFQKVSACPFCGEGTESIEHFCRCKKISSFANRYLHLPRGAYDSPEGLLCLQSGCHEGLLTVQLILLSAVYSALNMINHGAQPAELDVFLIQLCKQATFGHKRSQKWFKFFASNFRTLPPKQLFCVHNEFWRNSYTPSLKVVSLSPPPHPLDKFLKYWNPAASRTNAVQDMRRKNASLLD